MKWEYLQDEDKRRLLFTPCADREALRVWLRMFLEVDVPAAKVHPDSTSTPLDLLWEIYDAAMRGDEEKTTFLAYAARESMKCVRAGTRLSTARGLVKIEDVVVGDMVWTGWSWRPVTRWFDEGEKDAVTVRLSNGAELTTSTIHRVWAWEPGRTPAWKKVADLNPDDLVCMDALREGVGSGRREAYDRGYLCGILTGDGCLTVMDSASRAVLSTADEGVLAFWKETCLRVSGREPKRSKSRPYDWYINSVDMVRHLKALGLTTAHSWEKKIPEWLWSDQTAMAGFVSGLLDTDGCITKTGVVELAMTAADVVKPLLTALWALGVPAHYRAPKKLYGKQKHMVHNLWINTEDRHLLDRAGVRITAGKAQKAALSRAPIRNPHSGIPRAQLAGLTSKLPTKRAWTGGVSKPKLNHPTVSPGKCQELLAYAAAHQLVSPDELVTWTETLGRRWISVAAVSTGHARFYDITVDEEHSYWSDGFISHNTFDTAALEVLAVLHLERSVVHLAAIEKQSLKAQSYVKDFFLKPLLRDHLTLDNDRTKEVTWYTTQGGRLLTPAQYKVLPEDEKDHWKIHKYKIEIAVATLQSVNGPHAPLVIKDELDVMTSYRVYEESRLIPTPTLDGKPAITLIVSTRKFAFGFVQKEIDNADTSGIIVRHWTIIDVTEPCPPTRHKPELPIIDAFYNEDELMALRRKDYEALAPERKGKFVEAKAYEGCLANCKLFASCRGRLATHQEPKRKNTMLKPLSHVQKQFRSTSLEMALAQLLCKKPTAVGLIYPSLDREIHMKTAAEIAEMIAGRPVPEVVTRVDLIEFMRAQGTIRFVSGMDFGWTHMWAMVVGAVDGPNCFITGAVGIAEMEVGQQIQVAKGRFGYVDPKIYADPEDPEAIRQFRKGGFNIHPALKPAGSVISGIELVRSKLRAGDQTVTLFFLKDDTDGGVDMLFSKLQRHHWKLDAQNVPTDVPDDDGKDLPDALRYLVYMTFTKNGQIIIPQGEAQVAPSGETVYTQENWMQQTLAELGVVAPAPALDVEEPGKPKRGKRIQFDLIG